MEAADHAYLPPLERVASSSASSDVDQQIEIPLICLPECVVFPNETLPLRLRDRYLIQYFSSAMTRSDFTGLLGVWNYLTVYNHTEHVGIIAAIRAINCRDEEVVMQLKGKQRFHIIYLQRRSGVLFARVQLLADSVPYIAPEVHRTYHCDFRSKINSFPRWVYEAACARALCARIMSVIQSRRLITCGSSSLYLQLKNEAESHVEMFGYTLAANLPLTVQQRLFLLDCPDVSSRLREIYAICVDAGSLYMCAGCGQAIALRADLFTVPGAEGQVGAYVNPHGVVHQTVTFSSLLHLARVNLDGEPTVADSWFPGYAWTITYCDRCGNHLGWKFTEVIEGRSQFWGLRSVCLIEGTGDVQIECTEQHPNVTGTHVQLLQFSDDQEDNEYKDNDSYEDIDQSLEFDSENCFQEEGTDGDRAGDSNYHDSD